jgi:hypothetical protein
MSVRSPNIDSTGVQSLIDTRVEVERWANHAVEVSSPAFLFFQRTTLSMFLPVSLCGNPISVDPARPNRRRLWYWYIFQST